MPAIPPSDRLRQLQQTLGVSSTGSWDVATLQAILQRLPLAASPGDFTEQTMGLQRWLELKDDGDVGNLTLDALELALWAWALPSQAGPRPHLGVSRRGISRLVQFEITSPRLYRSAYASPSWPKSESGLTIGIGYDLGYRTAAQLRSDWGPHLPATTLDQLAAACGIKGQAAKQLVPAFAHITIGLETAGVVFFSRTLPEYARLTTTTYPGCEQLPADAQAALLSLIYNRGGSLSGDRRREMAAIKPLVANGNLTSIARELRAMKRLWQGSAVAGLVERRELEARLVEHASRPYDSREIIAV